jgi:Arc/MetJ-type ribon-helix-helix transcriptional regulator
MAEKRGSNSGAKISLALTFSLQDLIFLQRMVESGEVRSMSLACQKLIEEALERRRETSK